MLNFASYGVLAEWVSILGGTCHVDVGREYRKKICKYFTVCDLSFIFLDRPWYLSDLTVQNKGLILRDYQKTCFLAARRFHSILSKGKAKNREAYPSGTEIDLYFSTPSEVRRIFIPFFPRDLCWLPKSFYQRQIRTHKKWLQKRK